MWTGSSTMSKKIEIHNELFKESLKEVLENAKVPMNQHLGALKVIEMNLAKAKKDRETHQNFALQHARQMSEHQRHMQEHDVQISAYQKELERSRGLAKGEMGEKGEDGRDGVDGLSPSINEIVAQVLPLIPQPEKGEPGQNAVFDEEIFMSKVIDRLKKDKPLDLSHIKNAQDFVLRTSQKNIKVKLEEMLHGGGGAGGSAGTAVYGEVVSGSGTTWTLANVPLAGTLRLYADGQRLTITVDYSLSGATITTVDSWVSGTILADYQH